MSLLRGRGFESIPLQRRVHYLGQGALVLADPTAANPFFLLFPGGLLIPRVGLTTAATVIASQAVISGAFALAQQAIQLGAVPRLGGLAIVPAIAVTALYGESGAGQLLVLSQVVRSLQLSFAVVPW
jgi:Mn2+/Fe2+ NRAMP family transporter